MVDGKGVDGSVSRCVCEGGACFRGGRGFIFFVRADVHDAFVLDEPPSGRCARDNGRACGDGVRRGEAGVGVSARVARASGTVPAAFAERGVVSRLGGLFRPTRTGVDDPHVR